MTLTIAYSPCPNDTFTFDALVHQKVACGGIDFDVVLEDIEDLNDRATLGGADIIKVSYRHYPSISQEYQLLKAGSALGYNVGPILVSKENYTKEDVPNLRIAIPGENTTANFLLSLAYPTATNKEAILFSEIEDAILDGDFDAGLLIHESRFTYEDYGLSKIIDLGEWWQSHYYVPIPLGGICIRRSIDDATKRIVNRSIQQSVKYAFAHTHDVMPYVRKHAQAMDDDIMMQHIDLYVNHFTQDLGEDGIGAINRMYEVAKQHNLIGEITYPIFI